MSDVVDVVRVDITRAANAARHLYVATFLMGWVWIASLNLLLPYAKPWDWRYYLVLCLPCCFTILLSFYARRLHRRSYVAFIFEVLTFCGLFGALIIFTSIDIIFASIDPVRAVHAAEDFAVLAPTLLLVLILLIYLIFAFFIALRVFTVQYTALQTTPLELANATVRYARHHRSSVPSLHWPNRPVRMILWGIPILYITWANYLSSQLSVIAMIIVITFAGARIRRNYTLPADKVLSLDTRQPVLFLRSFVADYARLWGKGVVGKLRRRSIDEAIAPLAMAIGPFVAIANPDSKLPQLGAAKTYYTNDTWQGAIVGWVATAQMIVMVAGRTEGTEWELGHIFENKADSKLVVIIPTEMRQYPLSVEKWFRENFSSSPYMPALVKLDCQCTIALIFRENDIVAIETIETRRARRSVIDYWMAFQVALFVSVVAEREATASPPEMTGLH